MLKIKNVKQLSLKLTDIAHGNPFLEILVNTIKMVDFRGQTVSFREGNY